MADNEDSLVAGRERRNNAGARMSRLLDAEDDDEFYKTTYGGFTEEVDDNDYQTEESASDETDSDIDLDENEEVTSDVEVEGDEKRKRRVITKAYKEPKKQCLTAKSSTSMPRIEKPKPEVLIPLEPAIDRSSLRKSTCDKTRSTEDCVREREARSAVMRQIAERKHVADVRRLTQEELLAEAKITEKINLRSLETFQKLELEKKKSRVHRQTYSGPVIRYHSVTVPIVDELSTVDTEINVDSDTVDSSEHAKSIRPNRTSAEKCSRTFITFSDEVVYRQCFPSRRKLRSVDKSACPVTGLPAKYFDPLTRIPYATAEAFKVIRQSFQKDADLDITQARQTAVS